MKTIEQWETEYQPVNNTGDEYASWNGQMFETYGDDNEAVLSVATREPRRVWTLVDTDDGLVMTNGYLFVNRVGYFVTEREWELGATIEIPVTDGDVF
jgi:hypothetical protein